MQKVSADSRPAPNNHASVDDPCASSSVAPDHRLHASLSCSRSVHVGHSIGFGFVAGGCGGPIVVPHVSPSQSSNHVSSKVVVHCQVAVEDFGLTSSVACPVPSRIVDVGRSHFGSILPCPSVSASTDKFIRFDCIRAASRSGGRRTSPLPHIPSSWRTILGGSLLLPRLDVSVSGVGSDGSNAASVTLPVPSRFVGRAGASQPNVDQIASVGDRYSIVAVGADVGGLMCCLGAIRAPCGACCCHDVPLVCAVDAHSVSVKGVAWTQPVSRAEGPVSVIHDDGGSGAEVVPCVSDGHKYGMRRASYG